MAPNRSNAVSRDLLDLYKRFLHAQFLFSSIAKISSLILTLWMLSSASSVPFKASPFKSGRVYTFWRVNFFQKGKEDVLNGTAQNGKGDALNRMEEVLVTTNFLLLPVCLAATIIVLHLPNTSIWIGWVICMKILLSELESIQSLS